jgi:hypothetical protein
MLINQYPLGNRTVQANRDFIIALVNGQLADVPMNVFITQTLGGLLIVEGPFVNGVNFVAGTTTTLPLSIAYPAPQNLTVHFDTEYQDPSQYQLNGTNIVFGTIGSPVAIPLGVQRVNIIGNSGTITNTGSITAGPTAARPNPIAAGLTYFDESLGIPIWTNASLQWVDGAGVAV